MKCVDLLCYAATALADLSAGFAKDGIVSPVGHGLDDLIKECYAHLSTLGIDQPGRSQQPKAVLPEDGRRLLLLQELKDDGLEFGDCTRVFGNTAEQSPYVRAALGHVEEGSIEVDEPAVVSKGGDKGAYVSAWIWVEDSEAGVVSITEALETVLEFAKGSVLDGRLLPPPWLKEPRDASEAYCSTTAALDWLEDLISNYADEIEELSEIESAEAVETKLRWVDEDGKEWFFFPTEAIQFVLDHAKGYAHEEPEALSIVETFLKDYGAQLNRVLTVIQTS